MPPEIILPQSDEYVLIFDIFGVLFSYKKNTIHPHLLHVYHLLGGTKNFYEPIPAGIDILTKCHHLLKKRSAKPNLFILSNIGNALDTLMKAYPETFSLFDGIITSSNSGFKKPDPRIFLHLLHTYSLEPNVCIFIDDKQENVMAARSLGMQGIVWDTRTNVEAALKKHGFFHDV